MVAEILVVDMDSTDATVEVAQGFGARVVRHEPLGFAEPARAGAVAQARSPWVLVLDAGHPSLPALIESLFPSAKAPTNFPRTDLVTVFLKGLEGLNQPKNVTPAHNYWNRSIDR